MHTFEEQLDYIVDGLVEHNFAVVDHFLPQYLTRQLLESLLQLREEGELKKAGIGKQQNFQVDKTIRGDYIKWIDPQTTHKITHEFLEKIETLMQYLNHTCYLGLKDYESHFAVYPPGTFYKRHADRFQQSSHRIITFVYYLNPEWKEEDGGILRLYLPGDDIKDVIPIAGRLVCFRSELEHEVLLAHKVRYSITGWILNQISSLTFL